METLYDELNMETLYDELLSLQHITNAYEDWAEYRAALTDFIVKNTDGGSSALVVGAGECNDFDLRKLTEHFSKVLLLDRNGEAMRAGLKRQNVETADIELVEADLLGIPSEAYRTMCDALLTELRRQKQSGKNEPEAFEQMFMLYMSDALQNRRPSELLKQDAVADYVICCGVHSQLLNMFPQMAGVYLKYLEFDVSGIYSAVRAMNAEIAKELNTHLLHMAAKGVLIGMEESRIGMDGGIEGAAQGLCDIRTRSAQNVCETNLVWPFDRARGKAYYTKVMLLIK